MKTAICIATGASLTQEDVDYVRGKGRVYVVNDAYKLAPWADVLYACDYDWWAYHKPVFAGEKFSICPRAHKDFGTQFLETSSNEWSFDVGAIGTGGNSGYQCLNLAVLDGADRVVLLGYDMQVKTRKHFFGEHPAEINHGSDYNGWIKRFIRVADIIPAQVINCTRDSALNCFPKMELRDVL